MRQKKPTYKQMAWALLAVLFSISLVLSMFTALNYTEIARARIFSDIHATGSPVLLYDGDGVPEGVNLTIQFTIQNPSQKELKVWILNFKAWVRDLPMEDGADDSRWMIDGTLPVNGTEQRYYSIFSATYSFDTPEILVGADSNITVTKYLELNWEADPTIMSDFLAIYNYTADSGQALEWQIYSSGILFIQGIPPYSGPDKDANIIRRFQGYDLTPGIGGVGR